MNGPPPAAVAGWVLLALALAAAVLAVWAGSRRRRARRREVASELAALLRAERPAWDLRQEAPGGLTLLLPTKAEPWPVDLGRLAREAFRLRSPPARRALYRSLAAAAEEGIGVLGRELDLKVHGPRILPRLADRLFFAAVSGGAGLARTPLDQTGLWAVYAVLEAGPEALLTEEHLAAVGIDAQAVHSVALAVLRQRSSEEPFRRVLEEGRPERIEAPDGLGASRLLLVPDSLAPGEVLAAVVSDPATLILAPAPDPGGWEGLVGLAPPPRGYPLPRQVLRVTAGGVERA